jgi:hypothetical protein
VIAGAQQADRPEAALDVSVEATPTLIEMSDDEILAWLGTSILDEPDPANMNLDDPGLGGGEFWDHVSELEAYLEAEGYDAPRALERAIGFVGVGISLQGEALASPSAALLDAALLDAALLDAALLDESPAPRQAPPLAEQRLIERHAELLESAARAVSIWASLQGSALRAATQSRG